MPDYIPITAETPDWKLHCFMDWVAKDHDEKCDRCTGRGEIGGGFKSFDEAEVCPKCRGARTIRVGPKTPKPELPKALVEHMRRAYWDFFNKMPT